MNIKNIVSFQMQDQYTQLQTVEGDGPRVVLFIDEDEVLNQAFVVADKSLMIEINQPTIVKVVTSLSSCYYTFHREFPLAYKNALQFMANSIFAIEMTSIAAQKYLRTLRNFEK